MSSSSRHSNHSDHSDHHTLDPQLDPQEGGILNGDAVWNAGHQRLQEVVALEGFRDDFRITFQNLSGTVGAAAAHEESIKTGAGAARQLAQLLSGLLWRYGGTGRAVSGRFFGIHGS